MAIAALVLTLVVGLGLSVRWYWAGLAAAPTTGTVLLESSPANSRVLVDGRELGDTPLRTELSPGRHTVEFRRQKATRSLEVVIVAGRSTVSRLDWTAKRTGRLQVRSDPAGARVLVDGAVRGVTPLDLDDVTVGSHVVVLETAKGSVGRTVTVHEKQIAELSESIYSGWAHVSTPFEVAITEGGGELRLDERNLILLSPGLHALQFENAALGYRETIKTEVQPGATSSIAIVPPLSSISITSTVPAEVQIDGERAGETPIANRAIKIGTRDISLRDAAGSERTITVTVTTRPITVDVDFSKP